MHYAAGTREAQTKIAPNTRNDSYPYSHPRPWVLLASGLASIA
jgi:hypothetical protein